MIGDAAHTVHPLAGQGVNLGFGDVKALVDAIAHATETGMDIGSMTLLEAQKMPLHRSYLPTQRMALALLTVPASKGYAAASKLEAVHVSDLLKVYSAGSKNTTNCCAQHA